MAQNYSKCFIQPNISSPKFGILSHFLPYFYFTNPFIDGILWGVFMDKCHKVRQTLLLCSILVEFCVDFLVFVKIFIEIERIITHILTNILILPNSNPDSNPTTINSTTITIHGYYPLPDTNSNQLPFQTRILSSTFALLFICQVNPLYLKYHFNSHPLLLLAFL